MKTRALWLSLATMAVATISTPALAEVIEYTTKPGDTCELIAAQFWGDPKRWDKLHEMNPQLGPAPHHLAPGTVLKVIKPGPDALVTYVKNQVEAATPETHPAAKGEPLGKGNKVSTLGSSNAEVTFSDDTRIQLGEYTLVVILGSSSGKAQLGKTAEDTTLVKGTLSAFLSETSGKAAPKKISTPSAKIDLTSGTMKLSVDDGDATRLAVYSGKSSLSNVGKSMEVVAGFGSKAEKAKPPTLPKPLPSAPTWTAQPVAVTLTAGADAEVSGTYAAGTTGATTAAFHLQLARDAAFNDRILDAEVAATVTTLTGSKLTPGVYLARVSGIDNDKFEGPFGSVAKVVVGRTVITKATAGKRATIDVDAGDASKTLFCSLDGAPSALLDAPIELAPARAHTFHCATTIDGTGSGDLAIAASDAGDAVVKTTTSEPTFVDGASTRVVTLVVADATGAKLTGAKIAATASDGATVDAPRETANGYEATVRLPKGVAKTTVHFTLNDAQGIDAEVTAGAPPEGPSPIPERVRKFEVGAFGLLGTGTSDLGGAVGFGLEASRRWFVGPGAFTIGLRPSFEVHAPGSEHTAPCSASAGDPCPVGGRARTSTLADNAFLLGVPISFRLGGPAARFQPYVGLVPQLIVDRARETVGAGVGSNGTVIAGREDTDGKVSLAVTGMIGAQIVGSDGALFVEGGYRIATKHVVAAGDAQLRGALVLVGYRFAL